MPSDYAGVYRQQIPVTGAIILVNIFDFLFFSFKKEGDKRICICQLTLSHKTLDCAVLINYSVPVILNQNFFLVPIK